MPQIFTMDSQNGSRPAAFFDLDRTLISVNSAFLYAQYERRRGRISLFQFLRASFWMGMYHLSMIDMDKAFAAAVRLYRGAHSESLRALTEEFFHQEVISTFQPGAEPVLDFHRQQNHPLVLLTASSSYMSELVAETLDFDAWLANIFPTDDEGRLIGTFQRPMCYGPGKVHHAENWAAEEGIDLSQSYFYTDSFSDLPMLEVVGNPVVINPDPRLRRAALQRGWPIQDWSEPPTEH